MRLAAATAGSSAVASASLLLDGTGVPHPDPDGQSETMMRDLSDEDFGKASPWKEALIRAGDA